MRKWIPRISAKGRARLAAWLIVKMAFLEIPGKEFCKPCLDEGRKYPTQEVHHLDGREEDLLTDIENLLPVCIECHRKIHANPAWARSKGYLAPSPCADYKPVYEINI